MRTPKRRHSHRGALMARNFIERLDKGLLLDRTITKKFNDARVQVETTGVLKKLMKKTAGLDE